MTIRSGSWGWRWGLRTVFCKNKEMTEAAQKYIQARVHIEPATGCWVWQKSLTRKGYAQASYRGKYWRGHRLSYTAFCGPIPKSADCLDHLCNNRACVNPKHLEPTTQKVNVWRGLKSNATKTHCKHGHPFDEENTRVYNRSHGRPNGWRACKTCMREVWYVPHPRSSQ